MPEIAPKFVSASTLAGYRVRSEENHDLGSVEEILVDAEKGRIVYAVLCFGGTLGFGDRLFVVPWELLRFNASDRVLKLSWECERLAAAPAFPPDDWPDLGDESWDREIQDYYRSSALIKAG